MQRPGKTHAAGLYDDDKIRLGLLIQFIKAAKEDLLNSGDPDAAVRFEILEDWLREDYKGGPFKYTPKAIGL